MSNILDIGLNFMYDMGFGADVAEPYWITHYTKLNALESILNSLPNLTFRFTNGKQFEDKLEGTVVKNVYNQACEEMLNSHEISNDFFNSINTLDISDQKYFYIYRDHEPQPIRRCRYESYILCFCKNNNSPHMWDKFGKDGGSITVHKNLFTENINFLETNYFLNNYNGIDIFRSSIIYNDGNKSEYIKSFISKLYQKYLSDLSIIDYIKDYISGTFLPVLQFIYKDNKFCAEEEFRIIIQRPIDSDGILKLPDIMNSTKDNSKMYLTVELNNEVITGTGYELKFCNMNAKAEIIKFLESKGTNYIFINDGNSISITPQIK